MSLSKKLAYIMSTEKVADEILSQMKKIIDIDEFINHLDENFTPPRICEILEKHGVECSIASLLAVLSLVNQVFISNIVVSALSNEKHKPKTEEELEEKSLGLITDIANTLNITLIKQLPVMLNYIKNSIGLKENSDKPPTVM